MKIHVLVLALGGLVGTAAIAQAQSAAAPADPLADLQGVFGKVVGDAFHAPDPVVNGPAANASTAALGGAFRTSLEVPGSVFAGVVKPFADADAAATPAPAPAPVHRRHARLHHHHVPAQG